MSVYRSESGTEYVFGEMLAYQGHPTCTDMRCTRIEGRCVGWHCPRCDKPCSSQGHKCAVPEENQP